jgi:membrane protease YdiL (CAAX protease family)
VTAPTIALPRRRAGELVALFAAGPALLALVPRWLVSVGILASGLVCALVLARDPTFPRRELLGMAGLRGGIRRVLGRTLLVWVALLVVTAVAMPDALFIFPRTRPVVWMLVMVLYPLSAYAQEIVFRTFFFHRYAGLFRRPRTAVLVSGLLFGWAHIVVNNLLAIPLSALAGVLFASTYARSRSTLLVSIEHALYGDFVFTVGLGSIFYSTARWVLHAGG